MTRPTGPTVSGLNEEKTMKTLEELKSELVKLEERESVLCENKETEGEDEHERVQKNIRYLENLIDQREYLELFGFLYHRGPYAPIWYDNEDEYPGTRRNVTSGTSPFNEWYLCIDDETLRESLLESTYANVNVTEFDGKFYRCEDVGYDEEADKDFLKPEAEELDLDDLIHFASKF